MAAMRCYWEATIEPVWPRLRAVCTADLVHRMEQFADGGLTRVLADLHHGQSQHARQPAGACGRV
jgi:hypothetical protein